LQEQSQAKGMDESILAPDATADPKLPDLPAEHGSGKSELSGIYIKSEIRKSNAKV